MSIQLPFKGPLFIIGSGRSGTKLIRSLLNNHSLISIPQIESKFIPDLIKKYPNSEKKDFNIFFSFLYETSFFHRFNKHKEFEKEKILKFKNYGYPSEFIELILKYFSINFENFEEFDYIWGDKTPLYIRNVDLLKKLYPEAKFIHIIRDPRDVALSYKKTWGKSLYGSAEKWRTIIDRAETSGYKEKPWFFEIYYETLLSSPKDELKKLCNFLEIAFEHEMNELESPVEKFGDARKAKIATNNKKKYLKSLSQKEVKKIESIVKPCLVKKGYTLEFKNIKYQPLGLFQKHVYRVMDYLKLLIHHLIKEDGVEGVLISLKRQFKKVF